MKARAEHSTRNRKPPTRTTRVETILIRLLEPQFDITTDALWRRD